MTRESRILHYEIISGVTKKDRPDDIQKFIKPILDEAEGDYMLILLQADEDMFEGNIDLVDYYYYSYRKESGEWKCVFDGADFPEAIFQCGF